LNSTGIGLWAQDFLGDGFQRGYEVRGDDKNNVIVSGMFDGTMNVTESDAGPLTAIGKKDLFVAKFGPNGTPLWSRSFGGKHPNSDAGSTLITFGLAVDNVGNIIVPGYFDGGVDFGSGVMTSSGEFDIFLVKLTADGQYLWSKQFGGSGEEHASEVATDSNRNIVLTGWFRDQLNVGAINLASKADSLDVLLTKCAP